MARLRPDVLVVQEVEAIDNLLLFGGDNQSTYRDRIADPSSPRGLGLFSYTDTEIRPVDVSDPMGFRYTAQEALDRYHDQSSAIGRVRRVSWPIDFDNSRVLRDSDPYN
jgi:hypothetical protein